MTITDTQKWLQWAYAQYRTQDTEASKTGKIEIYLLSSLINIHKKLYGDEEDIQKSTLWTQVEKSIATAQHLFGVKDLPKQFKPVTIHGPSDPAKIELAKQKMREFKQIKGDQEWKDVCDELDVTLASKWKNASSASSSASSSALYLPLSNTNRVLTIGGLCTSLVEHVEGLKIMLGNQGSSEATNYMVMGALYHAIVTHFLMSNPSLRSKPASDLCLYANIEKYIQILTHIGVKRTNVSHHVFPIDDGNQSPLDDELMEKLIEIMDMLNQSHHHRHYEKEVKTEIINILESLRHRNKLHYNYYHQPRTADNAVKTFEAKKKIK